MSILMRISKKMAKATSTTAPYSGLRTKISPMMPAVIRKEMKR